MGQRRTVSSPGSLVVFKTRSSVPDTRAMPSSPLCPSSRGFPSQVISPMSPWGGWVQGEGPIPACSQRSGHVVARAHGPWVHITTVRLSTESSNSVVLELGAAQESCTKQGAVGTSIRYFSILSGVKPSKGLDPRKGKSEK